MASGSNAVVESKEDFGGKMKRMFSDSCTGLGIAVGVSTGLLEKMASCAEPKTSHQIADEMGMKERYVREWLGIMVCGDIVDLDATSETFFLPHHRRSYFTPGCKEQGASLMFRCLPMFTQSYDVLGKCFPKDGPIGFPDSVFSYRPEMSHVRFRHSLVNELETIPDLKNNLESGISLLDLGCGVGVSTRVLAEHYPNSRFIGLDLADDAIKEAQREAANQKLENVEFMCVSAMDMDRDWTDKFDFFFIFNMLHDAYRPEKVLQECLRVLKPGGKGVIFEPSMSSSMAENAKIPGNSYRYTFGLFRCVPTSIVEPDSPGFGPAWGKENICEMLEKTGFKIVAVEGKATMTTSWIFVCEKPV